MNIIRQGKVRCLYNDPLYILWQPSMLCNYKCSYCTQNDTRPKGKDWCTLKESLRMFDNLLEMDRDGYVLGIAGGEPTVNPHLQQVMAHIFNTYGNKLESAYIFSNGTGKMSFYESLAKRGPLNPFCFNLSLHTDHITNERIVELITTLSHMMTLRVDLMFNPRRRERVHEIFDILMKLRVDYPFVPFIQMVFVGSNYDSSYTEADYIWQRDASKMLNEVGKQSKFGPASYDFSYFLNIANAYWDDGYKYEYIYGYKQNNEDKTVDLKGKYCVLGSHFMNIAPDGKVAGSMCEMGHFTDKPLYEVSPYEDKEFCKPVICALESCTCMVDTWLQKFVNRQEAYDYCKYFLKREAKRRNNINVTSSLYNYIRKQRILLNKFDEYDFPFHKFVDQNYYFSMYPDVAQSGMKAAYHFKKYGWREGRNPAPWFDTLFYLSQFEDPESITMNPLVHYILYGCLKGKKCNINDD